MIEPTEAQARPGAGGGRPATLYRFARRELLVTHPFAAFRPPDVPGSEPVAGGVALY